MKTRNVEADKVVHEYYPPFTYRVFPAQTSRDTDLEDGDIARVKCHRPLLVRLETTSV